MEVLEIFLNHFLDSWLEGRPFKNWSLIDLYRLGFANRTVRKRILDFLDSLIMKDLEGLYLEYAKIIKNIPYGGGYFLTLIMDSSKNIAKSKREYLEYISYFFVDFINSCETVRITYPSFGELSLVRENETWNIHFAQKHEIGSVFWKHIPYTTYDSWSQCWTMLPEDRPDFKNKELKTIEMFGAAQKPLKIENFLEKPQKKPEKQNHRHVKKDPNFWGRK